MSERLEWHCHNDKNHFLIGDRGDLLIRDSNDKEMLRVPNPSSEGIDQDAAGRVLDIVHEHNSHAALTAEVARLRDCLSAFVQAYDEELWPIENQMQLFI